MCMMCILYVNDNELDAFCDIGKCVSTKGVDGQGAVRCDNEHPSSREPVVVGKVIMQN